MDLQRTKEARRDAPGKQEDSTEGPLEPYGGNGHSKDSPKNDSLDHRDTNKNKDPAQVNQQRQGPFACDHDIHQASPEVQQPACSNTPSPSSQAMCIPQELGLNVEEYNLLLTAKRYPPVTKSTLSELDLPCIMSNINLRMDANFDRDLHFKPDLDGEKGRRKRQEAADYWEAMATEITIYAFCAARQPLIPCDNMWADQQQTFEPRLPSMFDTLQDVLKTLVPERDHPSVMQNLEVPLLMQQIRKGVLDMVDVANWLAALLKTHCAPMRDEWADRMVEQISSGSRSQNSLEIVRGLQTLFAILEAMKLDVANHQIRAFRVLLIEDTIPFLQEYFRSKVERDNFRVESSRLWYQELRERDLSRMEKPNSLRPLAILFGGLSDLLLQFHTPESFPETFIFDSDRLWQLRACLQSLITLDICWEVFQRCVNPLKRYHPAQAQAYATFRSRIEPLIDESEDCRRRSPQWMKNIRCIALEIAHSACKAYNCDITMVPDSVMTRIENQLETHLLGESELFQHFQNLWRENLMAATMSFAQQYLTMSPLAICESQRSHPHSPVSQQHYGIERVAMRLAHMGVLHWRVWAPILYVRESVSPTDVAMSNHDMA
ncbi:T-complex protein 11-domain-containing protein [Aspergillus pseudotamarii]|uniref:T-complex protein 11-domain-containing protein n=1 Tax=Aspergillus pseudotamarii TaxID=132259 RepID=A0A5N6SQ77_ASPPS|nr:T-complex protein 11-domain-containing protein [Aspergillus pseudotamarii]KAE8136848.1 T-complex protein 11-domain-containing protein [Aspergillus pseudotamarii]